MYKESITYWLREHNYIRHNDLLGDLRGDLHHDLHDDLHDARLPETQNRSQ